MMSFALTGGNGIDGIDVCKGMNVDCHFIIPAVTKITKAMIAGQ